MDQPHGPGAPATPLLPATAPRTSAIDDAVRSVPQDDDERFIVGLVLSYYRRHPQRARTRLLDLLGEVLTPQAADAPAPATVLAPRPPAAPGVVRGAARPPAPPPVDDQTLWAQAQARVAPLKTRR